MDLIYCAAGNPTLVDIAYEEGWQLGLRSDASPMKYWPSFIDIDYKKPNFEKHLEIVARHRPKYATVPDLSEQEVSQADIDRAIAQAERLAPHCETVFIVPKLSGQIPLLPPSIAIGYSIPTTYGGAKFGIWKLQGGWRIHLLGGSPKMQMKLYRYMGKQIISADGNYAQLMATRYAEYWHGGKWKEHPGLAQKERNLYAECWRWSCRNIRQYWQALGAVCER